MIMDEVLEENHIVVHEYWTAHIPKHRSVDTTRSAWRPHEGSLIESCEQSDGRQNAIFLHGMLNYNKRRNGAESGRLFLVRCTVSTVVTFVRNHTIVDMFFWR